jgi:hypothetical protein
VPGRRLAARPTEEARCPTITGTTVEGASIDVRGCDIWTFDADGLIARKDSFWKIREA